MILALPVYYQRNNYSCGPVAVRIALDYLGARGRRVPASPIDGTDPRTLESALWLAGVAVQAGQMDVDDLRHHTRKGRPVIALVQEDGVGHWIAVAGVERGRVHSVCPVRGVVAERSDEFDGRWWDSDRFGAEYVRWGLAVG